MVINWLNLKASKKQTLKCLWSTILLFFTLIVMLAWSICDTFLAVDTINLQITMNEIFREKHPVSYLSAYIAAAMWVLSIVSVFLSFFLGFKVIYNNTIKDESYLLYKISLSDSKNKSFWYTLMKISLANPKYKRNLLFQTMEAMSRNKREFFKDIESFNNSHKVKKILFINNIDKSHAINGTNELWIDDDELRKEFLNEYLFKKYDYKKIFVLGNKTFYQFSLKDQSANFTIVFNNKLPDFDYKIKENGELETDLQKYYFDGYLSALNKLNTFNINDLLILDKKLKSENFSKEFKNYYVSLKSNQIQIIKQSKSFKNILINLTLKTSDLKNLDNFINNYN